MKWTEKIQRDYNRMDGLRTTFKRYSILRWIAIKGAEYEHPIAYNEALEDVKSLFNPIFKIDPKHENIVEIIRQFQNSLNKIDTLRK